MWLRRSAAARIAANRKRRGAIIGTPQLWTDAELWTLRTSDDVDELHYVEEGDDAPLVPAAELAKWMEARGATEVSVFISPLAHLLRPPPSSDAGPSA